MDSLNPRVTPPDELEKVAIGNVAGSAATLGTIGGLLGGGVGFLKGQLEGQDTGDSLRSAGKGALIGGGGGALLGGGLGGISRALRGRDAVKWEQYGRKASDPWYKTMDASLSDLGRRQVHGLTGYVPKGVSHKDYVHQIGLGGRDPFGGLPAAKDELKAAREGTGGAWWMPWKKGKVWLAKRDVTSAKADQEVLQTLVKHKATSLPGIAKAMLDSKKRGEVAKAAVKDAWHGGGGVGKVMMGMGAYDAAKSAVGDPQAGEEDMGRGARVGRAVGSASGMLIPSSLPFVGQMLGGTALSSAGKHVGSLADAALGEKPKRMIHDPTDPVASTAGQTGREVMMSPSAQGKPYGAGMEGATQ